MKIVKNTFSKMEEGVQVSTNDGQVFTLPMGVVQAMGTVHNYVTDGLVGSHGGDATIPLPEVSGKTLSKLVELIKQHLDDPNVDVNNRIQMMRYQLTTWDNEFFTGLDVATHADLIKAANYVEAKYALNIAAHGFANRVIGKTKEETWSICMEALPADQRKDIPTDAEIEAVIEEHKSGLLK